MFFTTFCSVSFFIKTMLFQKGKPLKKHFLFILLCFIHICKLSFLQKILLERKISPLISQLQRNLLNSQKIPQQRLFMLIKKEKGGENLPSSAVLKISCKLILRTKWWTEKDFQYSKTRKLLHPHNLSFTKCQNHVLRQTKRGTAYLYQTFHIALITVIRSCDIHCDYMRSW